MLPTPRDPTPIHGKSEEYCKIGGWTVNGPLRSSYKFIAIFFKTMAGGSGHKLVGTGRMAGLEKRDSITIIVLLNTTFCIALLA